MANLLAGNCEVKAKARTRRCGEEGSSIVEVAVASAIMFAMIFGIFETCWALYAYHFTADAAREASRWAMVRGSECSTYSSGLDHCNAQSSDIQTYIQNLGYPGLNANNLTAVATWYSPSAGANPTWTVCASTCNSPGNLVKVAVTYTFPFQVPYWSGATLHLGSTSQMVISQ